MADNFRKIPRISRARTANFIKDYVIPAKPVIITNLYEGQPIEQLRTRAELRKCLGEMDLFIGKNYYDKYLSDKANEKRGDYQVTLNKYIDICEKHPEMDLLCREQFSPPALLEQFRFPEFTRERRCLGPISHCFAAKKGLVAPIHFDGDQREVLFTQVHGSKRIFLMKPEIAARLAPLGLFAGIPVHHFEEKEKERFFAGLDAYECVLKAGETLYIPSLWWHYLENLEQTFAFNIRFRSIPINSRIRSLPVNFKLQNIVHSLRDRRTLKIRKPEVIDSLFEAYFGEYKSPFERMDTTARAYEEAFTNVCRDAVQVSYLPKSMANLSVGNEEVFMRSFAYVEPLTLGAGKLKAPASKAQLRKLEEVIRKHKVPPVGIESLLHRYGVEAIESATLLEANLLANAIVNHFVPGAMN